MHKRIKIGSAIGNIRIVENAIDEVISEVGIKQENYGKILVSTLEAVNNAIMHGNRYEKGKIVIVDITYKNRILEIVVSDEGEGFIPSMIPDPTVPENIESLNGRGIFLISKLADEVLYNDKGNSVTMVFKDLKS